jgi:subtilisin-like proprotein convertase family protein
VTWDSICAGEAQTKCGDLCTGGGGGDLICVNGNDDACSASIFHSTVEWCSQAGAEYLILVHGYGSGTGNFTLCVFDDGVSCPWTVDCGAAPPVGGCCQCDGPIQFCTLETLEDCDALGGEFLGVDEPCTSGGDYLVYESFPNVPIPDGSPVGVEDTITVTDSLTITDLNVDVVINHTWTGDLCVKLSKAGGPEVTLMKRINLDAECDATGCCGCSSDNVDVLLDDEAPDSVEDSCPPIGTYSPDPDSLSAFDGLDAAGDWTLWVNDNAGADTGTLIEWSLNFEQPGGDSPCAIAFPDQCNQPPDCSGAYASIDELWPPNHKYRGVTVEGVTDEDGDPITITILGIFQDEHVDALGDGSTCPDGEIAGDVALVRAERQGGNDGRVYHIFFLAEDGQGGACEGVVTTCVPHDQSGDTCVDQGPLYDSTDCGGAGSPPGWGN